MTQLIEQGNTEAQDKLDRKNSFILITSILIGVLYDILFFKKAAGVSYPIFIFLLYAVLYQQLQKFLVKKWCFECFLTFPVLALSLTYLLFSNQVLRTINSLLIPGIFVAHILLVTEKNRYEWFRWGFLKDVLNGLVVRPLANVKKTFDVIPEMLREDNVLTKNSVVRKVLVGLICSLPILVFVIVLLSSADLIFSNMMKQVFKDISFADIIIHSLLIGVITTITFSYLWGLTYKARNQVEAKKVSPKLDVVSVLTGLCMLNLVYGVFSYIQFAYLFGSISSLLPEGFTYAEYARRGFFELVVIAIVNMAIILGSLNYTKVSGALSEKLFKLLNSGLVASTFIMLFSSFFRMHLYEEVFGYTYLRVFTHEFMLMIFIMLCVTFYKIWTGRLKLAKWYIIISLVSYVLINYINVDMFIAQKNMERYYKTGLIDVMYFEEMSYDTTPYLEELALSSNDWIAVSAQKIIENRKKTLLVPGKWQSYNLSEQRAAAKLIK